MNKVLISHEKMSKVMFKNNKLLKEQIKKNCNINHIKFNSKSCGKFPQVIFIKKYRGRVLYLVSQISNLNRDEIKKLFENKHYYLKTFMESLKLK
jgi:hypothetical protein